MPTATRPHHANGGTRLRPTLEIIPDNRFIVFHGTEHEASSCKLSGKVRLTTPESMCISKPRIWLEGSKKISWFYLGGLSAGEAVDRKTIWNEEKKLGRIETPHKVNAGVIEWGFEFELSPSMPESVEGLSNTYIIYHLRASVSRSGWNVKDLEACERIRIVRTLGPESMELTRSRVNADIWANKLAYTISIPTDAVIFGTSITADVQLSPLKKGLVMGKVEMRLLESVTRRIQASEIPNSRADRSKTDEIEVTKLDMEFPEDCKVLFDGESDEEPVMDDEMYRFKVTLPLPTSLNECRQDVDSYTLSITHRFKLIVNLVNPEGHTSQLVCRLPVKLFISPNLPLNESNQVCRPTNAVTDEALNNNETIICVPPQYGEHQLDELFSNIDPEGHITRAPSITGSMSSADGSASPPTPASQASAASRSGGEDGNNSQAYENPSPSALHLRLVELEAHGYSSSARIPHLRGSAPTSRRASGEEDIRQSDYDMNNLSRVPSYGYALRTPGHITPYLSTPPTYFEATTSQPPSPLHRPALSSSLSDEPFLAAGVAAIDLANHSPHRRSSGSELREQRTITAV